MKIYEVVIVGGGPAGSTAAYHLARAGVKVAVVDKQTFPRDKVCGDGVAVNALAHLEQMQLGGWLTQLDFNAPGELLFSGPDGQAVRLAPDPPAQCYGRVIPRLQLDEAMLRQAIKAGAELLEQVKLTGLIRLGADRVQLSGQQAGASLTVESRLVITADGAHASFTRQLGLVKGQPDLVAVRAYFANVGSPETRLELHFDRRLMPGYAWIFPLKNGLANVGLGAWVSRARQHNVNLKDELGHLLRDNPYMRERLQQAQMVSPLRGYPLRSQMNSIIPFDDNVLVAGEAAGLVNPLNGEGIGPAILSGQMAAHQAQAALIAGDFSRVGLRAYGQKLRRRIGQAHTQAKILRHLLTMPGLMNRAVGRAKRDPDFGQTLFGVIIEVLSPHVVFKPGFILRLLAG